MKWKCKIFWLNHDALPRIINSSLHKLSAFLAFCVQLNWVQRPFAHTITSFGALGMPVSTGLHCIACYRSQGYCCWIMLTRTLLRPSLIMLQLLYAQTFCCLHNPLLTPSLIRLLFHELCTAHFVRFKLCLCVVFFSFLFHNTIISIWFLFLVFCFNEFSFQRTCLAHSLRLRLAQTQNEHWLLLL